LKEEEEKNIIEILIFKIVQLEKKYNKKFSYKALKKAYQISNRFIHDYSNPAKSINILEETLFKTNDNLIKSEDVNNLLKEKYNINLTKISDEESNDLVNLENKIHEDIIGQDLAIKSVSNALRKARLDIREEDSPIASFLFLGPTGVGKTELAKKTAEIFFGKNDSFTRIDMSEYPDKNSIYRLIGYYNDNEYIPGLLTDKIRVNPFSLILFDEIEKSHPDVLNLFLQLLDDARLTDGRGKVIDFKNTIIIATSNFGNEFIQESFKNKMNIQENTKKS
jgi:ATP-dependent Clp protease ATP-binding subunit ClpC